MTMPMRADSLAELFEMEGHHVQAVYSGDNAIEVYQDKQFDVAFMDIMMPGRNGVESFLEIKKLRPDAKVYMMTGFSVNELVDRAVDNGAMGVFSKPVDLERVFYSSGRTRGLIFPNLSDLDWLARQHWVLACNRSS